MSPSRRLDEGVRMYQAKSFSVTNEIYLIDNDGEIALAAADLRMTPATSES
jgi:hypothetical protein